jgi:CheY-like chemotaxis protein
VELRGGTVYIAVARDMSARRQYEAVRQERERLARELHDSVSQVLYGIGLGTVVVGEAIGADDERAREGIDYMRSLVDVGMAEMRALLFELRSEALAEEGLVVALEKRAAALRGRYRLEILTALGEEPAASLHVKEALYRVGQEALANALRHSRAERIRMHLETVGDTLVLEVSDDGIGFDPAADYPGHLGLRSMRERIERLGGRLVIESTPGTGTRVRTEVPILPPGDQFQQAPPGRSSRPTEDSASADIDEESAQSLELAGPGPTKRPTHILIVDDHPDFLAFSRLAFQQRGYAVTTTTLLPRTFDMVSSLVPDVLLVSLANGMSELRTLLERLARDPRTASIPLVIAGTNSARLEEAQAAAGTKGARAVILHPLAPTELAATIERVLGHA